MCDARAKELEGIPSKSGAPNGPSPKEAAAVQGATLHPILASARTDNQQALDALLTFARPVAYAVIRPRLRGGWCEDWTDDVVQEVLLDIVRAHGGCRAVSDADLTAWVAAIARREVAEFFRREHWHSETVGLLAMARLSVERDEPAAGAASVAIESLRPLMARLAPDQHELLYERLISAATWTEVGEQLGIPATAAKRRWQRLVLRLGKAVERTRPSSP